MTPIVVIEQIHHNEKWARFLELLSTQQERDIAGKVMEWVKETYPEFKDKLNGELIAEITRQK